MNVEQALDRAEAALATGGSLDGTGFWRAVTYLRSHRDEADRHADRVAAIDRRAFESGVRFWVPAPVGTWALLCATVGGVGFVVAGRTVHGLLQVLGFLAGFAVLEVSTHSLAHFFVGRLLGIRFTHYFIGGPPPPRPGVKIDYASYLRRAPWRRAVMHASGAIVTKAVPFAMLPWAPTPWTRWLLVAVGVAQIATDVLFSTSSSDWKKVGRELRAMSRTPSGPGAH